MRLTDPNLHLSWLLHAGLSSTLGRSIMNMARRWFPLFILLLVTWAALAACTRDRSTPEPEPEAAQTPVIAEPAVTPAGETGPTATPTPEPTATPTPEPETVPYTVQPGDTLSTIAEQFGTDSQTLREINLLPNDDLQVGQVLRVPNVTPTPTPTPEPYYYVIQEGDTLLSIALRFGVTAEEIVAANVIADPNNLIVGQVLLIPGYQPGAEEGEAVTASGEDAGQAGEAASQGAAETSSQPAVYVVKPGEYLTMIAERFGVSVAELVAANNIQDPDLVKPGTELIIPGLTAADLEKANQIIHVVKEGEGLYAIARLYGVDVDAIIEANNITNPDLIRVGDELIIPTE